MELLILSNSAGTHADVVRASDHRTVPQGSRARVIGPGESYLGVSYEAWRDQLEQSVDLLVMTSRTAGTPSARGHLGRPLAAGSRPDQPVNVVIGAVLDTAFQLIRRGALPLVALTAVLQIAPTLLAPELQRSPSTLWNLLWLGIGVVYAFLLQALIIVVLSEAYHGRKPNLLHAVRKVGRRGGAVIAAGLLVLLLVSLGSLALLVPGLILMCRYVAVPAVVLLEDGNPWKALGRSGALAEGAGWSIFATFGILQILSYFIRFGVKTVTVHGELPAALANAVILAANTFSMVLAAAVATAWYYALRVSREGYDVEMVMNALPGAGPVPAPA